jgi:hypothetical protein
MPIRINLLAEAQATEDLRRRDPVKRAIWVAVCIVIIMLAWSSSIQLKAIIAKGDLNRVEGQLAARTNEFRQVLENQKTLADVNHKLASLQQLATNRLLQGTLLNALQQTTIDDVQLLRIRAEQSYIHTEGTKPKTNDTRVIPGKPATVTERIVVTLDAKDSGLNPGDQVNKFKQVLADSPYFQSFIGKTNEIRLASLSPPVPVTGGGGKPYVQFTLECRFPDKTR